MRSLKGQLLLDGGQLTGSDFHRTVVLVCIHDADGAFGLVLNRQSKYALGEVISQTLPTAWEEQPLFLGGPVRPEMLSFLVHVPALPAPKGETVLPGLRLVQTLEDWLDAEEAALPEKMKPFAGYAGWSPGQLDDEMKRKAWLTHPATIEHVFDPHPENLWRSILRTMGPEYRLLAELPDDLSRN